MLRSNSFNPDTMPMPFGEALLLSVIGIVMVFLMLIILAVMIKLISICIRKISDKETKRANETKEATPKAESVIVSTSANVAPIATPTGLTLTDIDEPTVATVMALVSHETGIPLNRLNFTSIKGIIDLNDVDEREAAVIMALTAHKLGKPINKLVFKSIKKI